MKALKVECKYTVGQQLRAVQNKFYQCPLAKVVLRTSNEEMKEPQK